MPKKQKKRGQNEGSIRERKDGSWEARVFLGLDEDGKQKRLSYYGKTRAEVAKKMNKALSDLSLNMFVEPSSITLASWMDTYLWEYKKQSVKPKTFSSYEQLSRLYIKPYIGNFALFDLRPDHIQKMINRMQSDTAKGDT